jgi:hypothetical protein
VLGPVVSLQAETIMMSGRSTAVRMGILICPPAVVKSVGLVVYSEAMTTMADTPRKIKSIGSEHTPAHPGR